MSFAFTCTFCWLQYPHPDKPKALGPQARIACESCWREILNLSICWVCGEQILSGQEAISLGWCFWHQVCFGCLLCGTKIPVPSPASDKRDAGGDMYENLQECSSKGSRNSRLARPKRASRLELEKIPLCSWCEGDTEGMSGEEVLEMGVEHVSKSDGGLGRARLDIMTSIPETPEKMTPGANHAESVPLGNPEAGEDQLELGCRGCNDNPDLSSSPRDIYVSVLDPLHEPSFQPSKTKPIPRWMSLLPSGNFREKEKSSSSPTVVGRRSLTRLFSRTPTPENNEKKSMKQLERGRYHSLERILPRLSRSPSPYHDAIRTKSPLSQATTSSSASLKSSHSGNPTPLPRTKPNTSTNFLSPHRRASPEVVKPLERKLAYEDPSAMIFPPPKTQYFLQRIGARQYASLSSSSSTLSSSTIRGSTTTSHTASPIPLAKVIPLKQTTQATKYGANSAIMLAPAMSSEFIDRFGDSKSKASGQ